MRRLEAGRSDGAVGFVEPEEHLLPGGPWPALIRSSSGGRSLRPVQQMALLQARILETAENLVVCAPTNSGKSLIGHLLLLDAVRQGRRAVLVEPLRALAEEQADDLTDRLGLLPPSVLPRTPKVRIATGDYRLEGELPSDVPPAEGEIIVATPERLDAITRNPEHGAWISSVGALVVDEAHLLGDPRRLRTLELLVASMLSTKASPRIALLPATIGEPELLREWLRPCQIVTSTVRTPLAKEVWSFSVMRIRMRYSRTTFARFSTNHRARHSFSFTDEAQQRRLPANCRLNLEFPSADTIPVNPRMNGPAHAAAFWRAHVDAWLQPRLCYGR